MKYAIKLATTTKKNVVGLTHGVVNIDEKCYLIDDTQASVFLHVPSCGAKVE